MALPTEVLRSRTRAELIKQQRQPTPQPQTTQTYSSDFTPEEIAEYEKNQKELQQAISSVESEIARNMSNFQAIQEAIKRREAQNPEYDPSNDRRRATEYANKADQLRQRANILRDSYSLREASIRQGIYKAQQASEISRRETEAQRKKQELFAGTIVVDGKGYSTAYPEKYVKKYTETPFGYSAPTSPFEGTIVKEGKGYSQAPRPTTQSKPLFGYGTIEEAEKPKGFAEKMSRFFARQQDILTTKEIRGEATVGTRAAASALVLPQTVTDIFRWGTQSPEKAVKELYQTTKTALTPSTYKSIGTASPTELGKLTTSLFFTTAFFKGGKVFTPKTTPKPIKISKFKTIGVETPTKTGFKQTIYGGAEVGKYNVLGKTEVIGKIVGEAGISRGTAYAYTETLSGKPISQTGYNVFGISRTGGKVQTVKDYGLFKTKTPSGTSYVGKGGLSETYSLSLKKKPRFVKGKGDIYPSGTEYQPSITQAGGIKKIGTFDSGEIYKVFTSEKGKTKLGFYDGKVDVKGYQVLKSDISTEGILFKIKSKGKGVEYLKPNEKIKKTPLSKTFKETKPTPPKKITKTELSTETFGTQSKILKEAITKEAQKTIKKPKTAQKTIVTTTIPKLSPTERQLEPLIVGTIPTTKLVETSREKEDEKIIVTPKINLSEKTSQKTTQVPLLTLKQAQKQEQSLVTITPTTTIPTTTKPGIPIVPIPQLSEKSKKRIRKALAKLKGKAVNVSVGMEKGKKKIIYKKLPPKLALKKAQKYVDENIEASFKLVKTKGKPKRRDISTVSLSHKFRLSKRDPLYQVEKKEYRLDSPKESKQISLGKKKSVKLLKKVRGIKLK